MSARLERHGPLGTVIEVTVDADDDGGVEGADADVIGEWIIDHIAGLERTFSVFDEASELRRWARGDLDVVSTDLAAVLHAATHWQERSDGAFNTRASVLTARWNAAAASGVRPTDAELTELAVSIADPVYSVDGRRVERFGDCSTVTLNAIAKGAIVDRALERAVERWSPNRVTVSAGGDIRHHGDPPAVIGIEHPLRPYDNEPPLARVALAEGAIATSGGARRGVRVGGEWVSHVVDPRSGRPADRVASVSVVAADVCTADAVATICTVMGADESIAWLGAVDGAEALIVTPDGGVVVTPGWWRRVEPLS